MGFSRSLFKRYDRPWRKTTFGEFRQARNVPSPTESLDQPNAGFHATTQDIDIVALIRKRDGLPGDDLQVGILAPDVTVGEEAQRVLRRVHRLALLLRLIAKNAQCCEIILHLLKRCERGLSIRRNRGIVSRPRYLRLGMTSAAVEQFLRQ